MFQSHGDIPGRFLSSTDYCTYTSPTHRTNRMEIYNDNDSNQPANLKLLLHDPFKDEVGMGI